MPRGNPQHGKSTKPVLAEKKHDMTSQDLPYYFYPDIPISVKAEWGQEKR